jgi:hypothetical protein
MEDGCDLSMKQKISQWPIIAIVIFFVGFGISAYYFGTKRARLQLDVMQNQKQKPASIVKPNSPTRWRTVRFKSGFSLRLPEKWYPHEIFDYMGADLRWITYPVDNPSLQADYTGKLITNFIVNDYPSELPLEEWVTKEKRETNLIKYNKKKEIVVDNQKAVKLISPDGPVAVIFKKNGRVYSLLLLTSELELVPIFDKIIASFKFLDKKDIPKSLSDPWDKYCSWSYLFDLDGLFLFKYPHEYSTTNNRNYISLFAQSNSNETSSLNREMKIEIFSQELDMEKTLDDFITSANSLGLPNSAQIIEQKKTKIDGVRAFEQTIESLSGLGTRIYVVYRNRGILISKLSTDKTWDKKFTAILSTLKFMPPIDKRIDANDVDVSILIPKNMEFEKKIILDFNWDGQDEIVLIGKDKDYGEFGMGNLEKQRMPLILVFVYDFTTGLWKKNNEINYLNFPQKTNYSYIKQIKVISEYKKRYKGLVLTYSVHGSAINERFVAVLGLSDKIVVEKFPKEVYELSGGKNPHQVVIFEKGIIQIKEGIYNIDDSNNNPTNGTLQTTFKFNDRGIVFDKVDFLPPPNNLKLY